MENKMKSKKILKVIYTLMILSLLCILKHNRVEAKEFSNKLYYDYDSFEVEYNIDGLWNDGYNVRVVVTNKTDNVIEDWEVLFNSEDNIINIWNADITYNENDTYIISNKGWNKKIEAYDSIEWGYTANYENEPHYGCDFIIREKVTEDMSQEELGNVMDVLSNRDLEAGESVIVDNAYLIECEEEEEENPRLRAGAYAATKSSTVTFKVKVLTTKKKVFSITQKVNYVVNSVKNTVKITSHKVTFTAHAKGYSGSVKYESRINVENKTMIASFSTVTVKKGSSKGAVHAGVCVYSTGKCDLSCIQKL